MVSDVGLLTIRIALAALALDLAWTLFRSLMTHDSDSPIFRRRQSLCVMVSCVAMLVVSSMMTLGGRTVTAACVAMALALAASAHSNLRLRDRSVVLGACLQDVGTANVQRLTQELAHAAARGNHRAARTETALIVVALGLAMAGGGALAVL